MSERNGKVVGAVQVDENDEIMLISNRGTLVRTPATGVSVVGRNTQGVTLIKTRDEEKIVALQRIEEIKDAPVYEGEEGVESDSAVTTEHVDAVETEALSESTESESQE